MNELDPTRRGRTGLTLLWIGAVVFALVAVLATSLGLRSSGVGPRSAALVGRTAVAASGADVGLARSRPVHLSIPDLGVSVSLSSLGLNADGTVNVPSDFNQPGWYRFGASPGQLGTAVILGHVDSFRGPAVFFHLRDLAVGDKVVVTLANHEIARFRVIGVGIYLKTHFPARLVYGRRWYSALQLVTCGGTFDSATGSYLSNVVVYTARSGG